MQIEFANNRLRRRYNTPAQAIRAWGPVIGRRYVRRIDDIMIAENFPSLYGFRSLRLHRLSGRRAGQFSIALDRRWRLIITYNRLEDTVRIEEVTNHYGD